MLLILNIFIVINILRSVGFYLHKSVSYICRKNNNLIICFSFTRFSKMFWFPISWYDPFYGFLRRLLSGEQDACDQWFCKNIQWVCELMTTPGGVGGGRVRTWRQRKRLPLQGKFITIAHFTYRDNSKWFT